MSKFAVILVEWNGAADEVAYANVICDEIEGRDRSQCTRAEMLTSSERGVTEVLRDPGRPARMEWKASLAKALREAADELTPEGNAA